MTLDYRYEMGRCLTCGDIVGAKMPNVDGLVGFMTTGYCARCKENVVVARGFSQPDRAKQPHVEGRAIRFEPEIRGPRWLL